MRHNSQHGSSQWVMAQDLASCWDLLTQSAPPFWSSRALHLHTKKQFVLPVETLGPFVRTDPKLYVLTQQARLQNSIRRLTTVSRPFTSADTAYIVVSLQSKTTNQHTSNQLCVVCVYHYIIPHWDGNCVKYLDVWQSQIPPCFSNVRRISSLLPYCAVD